nr:retrovirus-related Pol polyprotein from transposon TNT 1-94 [Tanacetum cinerariifolium]
MVVLTQRIDDLTKGKSEKGKINKGKSEKGLIVESFDRDEESVSSKDKGTTRIRASMGKADARSGQWVHIIMKKNEVIRVNLKNESLNDEISELKKVIEKWTCSKVTLDQLISEQIPCNIVKAFGGKGRRKENNPSKEVLFSKADVSTSKSALMITFDSEDDSDIEEPLPLLLKLTEADPSGCEICGSIAHEIVVLLIVQRTYETSRNKGLLSSNQNPLKNSGCSRHMIGVKQYLHGYSKESGPKVVFGDDSSGDTEGYGSVNCNGITFTRVAYVNGLKHNLISI